MLADCFNVVNVSIFRNAQISFPQNRCMLGAATGIIIPTSGMSRSSDGYYIIYEY